MQPLAYIRVSTDEQVEKGNSMEEQVERIKAYCLSMEWKEPIIYRDDGKSAKDLKRPDLTRMLDDVRAKRYENPIVITTKLDRLCRNLLDLLNLVKFFEDYTCCYSSVSERFDTSTAAGKLVLQILGAFAEFERERIRERVKDNMLSLAKKGEKIITRPCFGYDVVDGIMQINLGEALIVGKMVEWIMEGHGGREVAKRLNSPEYNVPTKEGNTWNEKVVREFLKRETLIGNSVYNKTYKKNGKVLQRPESEWIRIVEHHDPIVDKDAFQTIQQLFSSRKTAAKHSSDDKYLLSGLVSCVHCGSKMNGKHTQTFLKRRNETRHYYRYVCDGYLKKGMCKFHYIHRDDLEDLIIKNFDLILQNKADNLKVVATSSPGNQSDRKDQIEARLNKLDAKMQRQIEAYEDELITRDALKQATARVEEERKKLLEELKTIDNEYGHQGIENVHKNARRLSGDVHSGERLKMKNAIRQIVHSIEIADGEKVSVTWLGN